MTGGLETGAHATRWSTNTVRETPPAAKMIQPIGALCAAFCFRTNFIFPAKKCRTKSLATSSTEYMSHTLARTLLYCTDRGTEYTNACVYLMQSNTKLQSQQSVAIICWQLRAWQNVDIPTVTNDLHYLLYTPPLQRPRCDKYNRPSAVER